MDVDGVLTNGSIVYDSNGNELKFFNVQDGFAINRASRNGISIYFITARESKPVTIRAEELGIKKAYQGIHDKNRILNEICGLEQCSPESMAYIGDDIVDIPVMKRVGLPIAVANACKEVKKHAKNITKAKGGEGAVREAIELILREQGIWEKILQNYI